MNNANILKGFFVDTIVSDTTKKLFAKLIEKSEEFTKPFSIGVQKSIAPDQYAEVVEDLLNEAIQNSLNEVLIRENLPFVIHFVKQGNNMVAIDVIPPVVLMTQSDLM